mgnify:CR=1 FL=1
MIGSIYKKSLAVLAEKPFRLWGISLLNILLTSAAYALFGVVVGVAVSIGLLLETSMTLIYLNGFLGQEVRAAQLFDCFRDWHTLGRVLGGMAWMLLWVTLWSLIPVVGIVFGVIKAYSYRLTPYILMREPDVKATDACKVSAERTQGFKGKMFLADVLAVLAVCAAVIILSLLSAIPYLGWLFGIANFVLIIAAAVFMPLFLGLVQSAFYVEIEKSSSGAASAEQGWYD